jgi:hypothetical protein
MKYEIWNMKNEEVLLDFNWKGVVLCFWADGYVFAWAAWRAAKRVRSTERSEPRKVATRSEAKGHALI